MSDHPVIMPKLGQAMEFGTIAEWLAADGAMVRAGQAIASVESDKATFEIEATESGVIHHLAALGDEVAVGQPFASIGAGASGAATEAPTGGATLKDRAARIAKGGLDAAGFVRSPYSVDGKQRLFAEPPHMQASMLFLSNGAQVPSVGDEVDVRVRFTATTFDETVIS